MAGLIMRREAHLNRWPSMSWGWTSRHSLLWSMYWNCQRPFKMEAGFQCFKNAIAVTFNNTRELNCLLERSMSGTAWGLGTRWVPRREVQGCNIDTAKVSGEASDSRAWPRKARGELTTFIVQENKKVLGTHKRTQVSAWRNFHWLNLGPSEYPIE